MNFKPEKSVFLLALYLILIGSLWLPNIFFLKTQRENANDIYQAGINTLTETNKTIKQYEFPNESQKAEFDAKYDQLKTFLYNREKLKVFLNKFKEERVDTVPLTGIIIGLCALITGGLYIFSGIYLIRRSKAAQNFLKWAIGGYLIFLSMLIIDLILIFYPLDQILKQLWGPPFPSIFQLWCSMAGAICIILGSILYIGLPLYFIKRPKIQSQLN